MNPTKSQQPKRGTPDFLLLFLTLGIVGFGLIQVYSASSILSLRIYNEAASFFFKKQVMWAGLGTIGMFVIMNIPYRIYQRYFIQIMLIALALLFIVLIPIPGLSEMKNGARSWLKFGGISVQPVELAKIAIIVYLAGIISKKEEKFRDFKKGLRPALIVIGAFVVLLFMQPDLGGAVILMGGAMAVIVCGGANLKDLIVFALKIGFIGAVLVAFLMMVSNGFESKIDHAIDRFTSFVDPWDDPYGSDMQLIQAKYGMGHGGLDGAGFGKSIQKFLYLPYPHTDFIFAILAEEMGFIGTFIFLMIYLLFLLRALIVCLRSDTLFGRLLGVGIVSLLAIQTFINVGGVVGLIPITGVPLPFISYGGSSLLVYMCAMGILLSISRTQRIKASTTPTNTKRLSF